MKELLEYIAKKILPHAEDVMVEESINEDGSTQLRLVTHPEDAGLAIGKEGKTARALRELLKIKAIQLGVRVYLKIQSTDEYQAEKEGRTIERPAKKTAEVEETPVEAGETEMVMEENQEVELAPEEK
jgi:uncharacterized protein